MLEGIDKQLFLFLNSCYSPFWDRIMHAVSGVLTWVPLYIAILVWLGFKYKRKFVVVLIFIVLAATLADQLSVHLFKNVFHRLRPCHEPSLEGLVHLVNGKCGGLYGFVSSHATNSFNIALISLLLIRKKWFTISIILWALIVGYSRIYLGVHYPGDIIGGSVFGALIGWGIYEFYILTDRKILQNMKFFASI